MLNEASLRLPVLINTLGNSAGLLLFGFIVWLLLRDRRLHATGETKLSIAAAALAFGWNAGSLGALAVGRPDLFIMSMVMAASFALLSLLPAVLLHVALRTRFKAITLAGYGVAIIAVGLHIAELFTPNPAPHQLALLLIAGGFASLTLVAVVLKHRHREPEARREWISLVCLLLFAVSFPHFGYQHLQSPWTAEIAWHHIGIPLVLIVLLQDYRFLLLDAFIRFLMNSLLAAAYVTVTLVCTLKLNPWKSLSTNTFLLALALIGTGLSLIVFAHVRNRLQQWIGGAIFHRRNLEECIRLVSKLPVLATTEPLLISEAASLVAGHLSAEHFAVISDSHGVFTQHRPVVIKGNRGCDSAWAEVQMPLHFSNGENRLLLMGPRRGRQRYLSEDIEDLRRLACVIVEQVERFRSEELRRLATQAELRALQAQINPHFLFNAFNTLYGVIDREALQARRMVLNLTEIFRYHLQGDRLVSPFSEELRIVRAYLEIETLRLGGRLETAIDVDQAALPVIVPVLSLQPLVENAVKHGVASKLGKGRVSVRARIEEGILRVTVQDTCFGSDASGAPHADGSGVGLANVRRRLSLSYGSEASLTVSHDPQGCVADILIPMSPQIEAAS